MTALATPADLPDQLEQKLTLLRDTNIKNAQLAAGVVTLLVERLGTEAVTSPDVELARKTVDTLLKVAVHPEKQEAANKTASAAAAILTIVLDDTPQVAPPRKKRALANVSDAIEIQAAPADTPTPNAVPADHEMSWGTL